MTFFRFLDRAYHEVEEELANAVDDEVKENALRKKEALDLISEYVMGFSWLRYKKTRDRITAILKSNYDYVSVAREFNTTVESLQTTVWYCSKILDEKIGRGTIDLIMKGNVEEGILQFYSATGYINVLSVFPDFVANLIPGGKKDIFLSLKDCIDEINLLRNFTNKNIKLKISSCSEDKLSFLRYVMESGDSKYSKHRLLLYNYFNNSISDEDLRLYIDLIDHY